MSTIRDWGIARACASFSGPHCKEMDSMPAPSFARTTPSRARTALACIALTLVTLLAALPALAQDDVPYLLSFPSDSPTMQAIAPGGQGSFAFTLQASASGMGVLAGIHESPNGTLDGYTFESEQPARCALPLVEPYFGSQRLVFVAGPLVAGESLTCRYSIRRALGSIDDLAFHACGRRSTFGYCAQRFRRGNLPDLALSVEPEGLVAANATEAIVRLRLDNPTPFAVASRIATTDCREFAGGFFDPAPFTVDTTLPDGCAAAQGMGCGNFTGQNFDSYGFRLGPVAAGGSVTCRVRLRLRAPASGAVGTGLMFLDDRMALANGGLAFDPQPANDDATLGIIGVGTASAIPIGPAASMLLALCLVLLGLSRLRTQATARG
jgi:hypothetical protein